MNRFKSSFCCVSILGFALLILIVFPNPIYAVVGAVEVVAAHNGQPVPEAKIMILQGDEIVAEEKADSSGVALIPLEQGDYTVVIESSEKVVRDTITVGAGQLVSITGDVARNSIRSNPQPLNRYRPLTTSKVQKGYSVSLADLGGLLSYRFATPQGSIYLGFPYYAVPDETVSFSAILLPEGTDARKAAKNMQKLSEYVVMIDEQRFPLRKPTLWHFKARMRARVILFSGRRAQPLIEVMVDFRLQRWAAGSPGSETDSVYFANAGWPVCIPGRFDGMATNTRVYYGESQMEVTAETPSCVIFNPPRRLRGLRSVRILEGESTSECLVRNVYLELTADKHDLWRGETTGLHLKIFGLEGLERTAYVSLFNQTTSVVTMSGGNSQFFVIQPGEVGSGGVASYERTLTGIKRGTFVITAILGTRYDPIE